MPFPLRNPSDRKLVILLTISHSNGMIIFRAAFLLILGTSLSLNMVKKYCVYLHEMLGLLKIAVKALTKIIRDFRELTDRNDVKYQAI